MYQAKTLFQMEQTIPAIEEESVAENAKQTHPHHEEDTDDDYDDDVIDPDYKPSPESSAPENEDLAMVAATLEDLEDEDVDENNTFKNKRQKHLSPERWKQNQSKEKRLKGMPYKGKCGNEVTAKAMGPPCNSKFCQRANTRDCQSITEEQRQWIFQKVWSMDTWEERRSYVTTLVTKVAIKQRKVAEGSRRNSSFSYQLKLQDGTSHKVCKAFFPSTLGLPERTITCWLNEDTIDHDKQAAAPPTGPKSGKHEKLDMATTDFLKEWLKDLPTVDSHYCRSTATYKDKKFLHPGTTISQLLREYQQAAATAGVRAVGIKRFTDVFHEGKYSVFILRKDQCDVCVSFKHGNITKAEYDAHVNKKDEARQEKSRDKDSANNHKSVWTMDLQAMLLCPKTQASCLYY